MATTYNTAQGVRGKFKRIKIWWKYVWAALKGNPMFPSEYDFDDNTLRGGGPDDSSDIRQCGQ